MSHSESFPHLFTPFTIGRHEIANRVVFTGHDTCLPEDGKVNDEIVAYLEKRARHGAGLIVLSVSGVHESARYNSHLLMANDEQSVPGYRRLAEACQRHGTVLFAQLFHPGREIVESPDGLKPVAYSASGSPQERYHVMPRALSRTRINEIIQGFAESAERMQRAGIQGVEILASHGYLPAQFLNPNVNHRQDEYGGDFAGRVRFLEEVIDGIRERVGDELAVGMRISCDERDPAGIDEELTAQTLQHLESKLDYVSLVAGTSSSLSGSVHIVPPMAYDNAYLQHESANLRDRISIPIILTGRINQPQEAEAVIKSGAADLCGMTRALICDPEMTRKAKAGDTDGIRACIACNQACIGHFQKGLPISCIQYPESGRELQYDDLGAPEQARHIAVLGGGPAGMKAAVTAAIRGHAVTLHEAQSSLGGQARLAQLLPGRSEFGGLVTNLLEEIRRHEIKVITNTRTTPDELLEQGFDHVVVATGASPYAPPIERMGKMPVTQANDVLTDGVPAGEHVVVYDTQGDWVGMGVAELLAKSGARVTLAVNGLFAGESIQSYVREGMAAELHNLGVEVRNYIRLFGVDDDSVYCHHTAGGEPVVMDNVDHVVLACGGSPNTTPAEEDQWQGRPISIIGDSLVPRTAEEAVFDGLKAGCAV